MRAFPAPDESRWLVANDRIRRGPRRCVHTRHPWGASTSLGADSRRQTVSSSDSISSAAPASDQLTKTRQSDHVARPRLQIYRSAPRLYLAGLRSLPSSPHATRFYDGLDRATTSSYTDVDSSDGMSSFFFFSTADFFIRFDPVESRKGIFFFFKSRCTYESYYIRWGMESPVLRDKIVKLRSKNFS